MLRKFCCFSLIALFALHSAVLAVSAEISSKGKKAEKLIGNGNISGAMEIYKELIDKNAQKNPGLATEGKEGMANCLLLLADEALKKDNAAEAKTHTETILGTYPDTAAVNGASECLVKAQLALSAQLLAKGEYDECMQQCNAVKAKVASSAAGLDKLNGVIGTCLYTKGKQALDKNDFKAAADTFESIVKDYAQTEKLDDAKTGLAESLAGAGAGLFEKKNYPEALALFQRVVKELPERTAALEKAKQGMSKVGDEFFKAAETAFKAAKYDDALKQLDLALGAAVDNPFTAKVKYTKGTVYRTQGQDDKASACYQDVVSNHKDTPSAAASYHDLYLLALKQNKKQDALDNIKQAVMLAQDNGDYLFKQAQLLTDLSYTELAQKAYSRLIAVLQNEIQNTFVEKEKLQYKLGVAQLRLGNYTEAAVEFDKALTRNPSMLEARIGLANAQFSDKNYAGAINTYTAIIEKLLVEFEELQRQVDYDKTSIDAARKLEEVRKQIAFFHYQTGLAYEQKGDLEKALAECRLGFEGVSTQEAATTLKRIQASTDKIRR